MNYFIYALFRSNGQPFYIGKGSGNRISLTLNPNNGSNRYKSNLIRATKAELGCVPYVLIHEHLSEDTAYLYEIELIRAIGRYPDGPLVNATAGGEGLRNASEAVRAAIARGLAGNKNSAGCSPSLDTRRLLSEGKLRNKHAKGHKQTAEHKQKIAISVRQRMQDPVVQAKVSENRTSFAHSEETKQKLRAARAKQTATGQTRGSLAHLTPEQRIDHRRKMSANRRAFRQLNKH